MWLVPQNGGLKALCRQKLPDTPYNCTVFVFTNRMHTSVKLLVYDASGFWLCQKGSGGANWLGGLVEESLGSTCLDDSSFSM
ncbi:IS66 family insertion sequence element accessory protein TnpB [Legionella cherrii]|uniref:IS66 family insertion sequence element accessory protein TnpB n=1 Tax=Legionella cherrii TaxID=28084 RepID=UPI0009DD2297